MLEYYDIRKPNQLPILAIVGLLYLTVSIVYGLKTMQLVWQGVRTDGTVVGLEKFEVRDRETRLSEDRYKAIVEFSDEHGTKHEFTSNVSSNLVLRKVGSTVRVIYLPGKPETAEIDGFLAKWLFQIIFFCTGLVFGTIGIVALFGSGRNRRLAAKLRRSSTKVSATVTAIRIGNAPVSSEFMRQYKQTVDARTSDGIVYASVPILPEFAAGFVIGGIVDIYVSPENPKSYLIEVPPKGTSIAMPAVSAVQAQTPAMPDAQPPTLPPFMPRT